MSYDDASLDRGADAASGSDGAGTAVADTFRTALDKLRTHFEEWSGRYVEQQAKLYSTSGRTLTTGTGD